MNSKIHALTDLTIVGYAEDRPESMLPGYVPPVFRTTDGYYLVAPYVLQNRFIDGATEIDEAEFDEMCADKTIIRLEEEITPKSGHWAWLNEAGDFRYDEYEDSQNRMGKIHKKSMDAAMGAWRKGEVKEAMSQARRASIAKSSMDAYAMITLCYEKLKKQEHANDLREMVRTYPEVFRFETEMRNIERQYMQTEHTMAKPASNTFTFLRLAA